MAFSELADSPEFDDRSGRVTGVRRFIGPWSETLAMYRSLRGSWTGVGAGLVFTPPAYFPGIPNLICTGVSFKPFVQKIETPFSGTVGVPTETTNQPTFALCTAFYEIPDSTAGRNLRGDEPTVPDGTYITYSRDIGAEYLTIPGRSWFFEGTGKKLPEDTSPGILIPKEEFSLVWERVPYQLVPWLQIQASSGTLNDAPFMNWPAGCVLFLGAQDQREMQYSGELLCKLSFKFSAQKKTSTADGETAKGWNYFWSDEADGGEHWLPILGTGGGNVRPYSSSDFNLLFSPANPI